MGVRGTNVRRARSPLRRLNKGTLKIASSSDDASEGAGIPSIIGETHQMTGIGTHAGLRFRNFPVENAQEIIRAVVSVTLSDSDKNDAEGTWFAHAHDDSPTFTTADGDVDGRTKTTASVAWTTNDLGSAGNTVSSPNLATVLQEVVNRPGYQAGNAVTLIYVHNSDADKLTFYAWDDPTNPEPSLFIEYLQKIPGHWREEEDKWVRAATISQTDRGFKAGDATSSIQYFPERDSIWAHADTLVGAVDANGILTSSGLVKNSAFFRLVSTDDLNGQIFAQPTGAEPAWRHPDHPTGGFTEMDMVFDGSGGNNLDDVVVIGWAEPTTFGGSLGEGLMVELNAFGGAGTFTEYDLGPSPGIFFVTSVYNDVTHHYIVGMEFVIGLLGPFASHYVQRYIRLGRAPIGSLTNSATWEYWTGSGWSSTLTNAVRLKDNGGRELEGMADLTRRPNGDYMLVFQSAESQALRFYRSTSIEGPWEPYHYSVIPRRRPYGGADPPHPNMDYWYGFPKFQEYMDYDGQTVCISHSQGLYAIVFGDPVGNAHISQGTPNVVFVSLAEPFFPRLVNKAVEVDIAHPIKHVRPVGIATETDTAHPITQPVGSIGIATETDTANPITAHKVRTIGVASETDTALAIIAQKLRVLGLATEIDTALAINRLKVRALGVATETDTALAILARKLRQLGVSSEVDTALAITSPSAGILGHVVETDSALAIRALKFRQLGLASEVDIALAIRTLKLRQLGVALETDAAFPLVGISTRLLGLATELDTAWPITPRKFKVLGHPVEIDTALPFFDSFAGLALLLAPGLHNRVLDAPGIHERILQAVGAHNA